MPFRPKPEDTIVSNEQTRIQKIIEEVCKDYGFTI